VSGFLFLGAVSCALASAFFWLLAVRAGDRRLAWMTAVAVVLCCVAALFLLRTL
jgi:asparagine N-glycosylation enzyme membrane subunit Stt3